jgi:hypothetical protein
MTNAFLELFNSCFTKRGNLSLVRQRPPKDLCDLSFPMWGGLPQDRKVWAGCTNGESRDGSWKVFPGVGLEEVLIYISDFLFQQVCL